MAQCANCGAQIGFIRKVTASGLCEQCESERDSKRNEAREVLDGLFAQLAQGDGDPGQIRTYISEWAPLTGYSEKELARQTGQAFRAHAEAVLGDDILTEEEEERFQQTGLALGIEQEQFDTEYRDVLRRLAVARINDGRLQEIPNPTVMTKKGEVVHIEAAASLLKEVTIKERHGGYGWNSVSFPIKSGVRFSTGKARTPTTSTRTEIQVVDSGTLAVTSKRVIFLGQGGTTLEMPYSRLLQLGLFTDGLQFYLANRKSAPVLQVAEAEVCGALINAAAARAG